MSERTSSNFGCKANAFSKDFKQLVAMIDQFAALSDFSTGF